MKAIVYSEFGPPEVLHTAEIAKPAPIDDQVLIRVQVASVNCGDLIARNMSNISRREFNVPSKPRFGTRVEYSADSVSRP